LDRVVFSHFLEIIFSFGELFACVFFHFLVFGWLVFGLVFCGGENLVEGLSETMKAAGMRGSGKEGKD
jgi:hypothetical protein